MKCYLVHSGYASLGKKEKDTILKIARSYKYNSFAYIQVYILYSLKKKKKKCTFYIGNERVDIYILKNNLTIEKQYYWQCGSATDIQPMIFLHVNIKCVWLYNEKII